MISIIVGTNRDNSKSEVVAAYYQVILKKKGIASEIILLKDLPENFITSDLYKNAGKDEQFNRLLEVIVGAKKLIFIVPEYNGSFPGVLKAFIDGMPYPKGFEDKKIALVGLSSGIQGGALALSHLSDIFSYLNAHVFGQRVKLIQIEKNLENGLITNDLYNQLIEAQINKFIEF